MPEACSIEFRVAKLDIDEMPVPGLLVMLAITVPIRVTVAISPGRGAGDVVRGQRVGVGGKHRGDLFPDGSLEKLICDQGDDAVALIAPRERRSRRQGDGGGDEYERYDPKAPARNSSPHGHSLSPAEMTLIGVFLSSPLSRPSGLLT